MTAWDDLRRAVADAGCTLLRAVPRSESHLLLQVRDADGVETAGQWFADPARAAEVAAATAATRPDARVRAHGPVVLQPEGADRRLPGLADLVRRPGARLVSHRPERRAVVAHVTDGAPRFTKVVRRDRVVALADGLRQVAAVVDVPVPEVVAVDAAAGSVTTAALPGRTLHERLGDGPELDDEVGAVGHLVAELHAATPPDGTPAHEPADEVAVVRRWLGLAETFGATPVPADVLEQHVTRMEALLDDGSGEAALLHRDLHDKQLLLGPERPGVLDLDLLAAGDPALDLANLLVHLELRARQGLAAPDQVRRLAGTVVAAYDPSPAVRAAVPGYLLATRLRLVGVYAFRPASTAAAVQVLTDPLLEELPG